MTSPYRMRDDHGAGRLPEPGDLVAGRYLVRERIGEGGMGLVLLAEDQRLNEIVALKVIREGAFADAHQRARFLEEARLARSLRSPRVVSVFDAGESDGLLFLSMEYLQGSILLEAMQRVGDWAVGDRTRWGIAVVEEVLRALRDVHEAGVVHRDVKPSNVMLIEARGTSPRAKLMDFGLAFVESDRPRLTRTGWILGTQGYMAPEQAMGTARVAPAADIYPCGMMLAQILQGFDDEPSLENLDQRAGVSGLARVVRSFLATDPSERPQDAGEALRALGDLVQRAPTEVGVEPEGPPEEPPPVRVLLRSRSATQSRSRLPRRIELDPLLDEAVEESRIELPHDVYELTGPISKTVVFTAASADHRPTILLRGTHGLQIEHGTTVFEGCRLSADSAQAALQVGGAARLELRNTQVRCDEGVGVRLSAGGSLHVQQGRILAREDCVVAGEQASVVLEHSKLGSHRGRCVNLGHHGALTIERSSLRGGVRGGLRGYPGSSSVILDTEIRGRAGAMLYLEAAKARIHRGSLSGGTTTLWATRASKLSAHDVQSRNSKGVGLRAVGADRIRLVQTHISGCLRGAIQAEGCRLVRLVRVSVLCNQGDALSVVGCDEIDIRHGNLMDGDPTTLSAHDTRRVRIKGTNFQGWPRVAVQLHRVADAAIRDVRVQNAHDHAIEVRDCDRTRIERANCCQHDVSRPLVVLGGPAPQVIGPL